METTTKTAPVNYELERDTQKNQTKSKTEQLMKDVRKTSVFRALIPMEAEVGLPIPLLKNGKVYAKLPFYRADYQPDNRRTVLYPPLAVITLDWSSRKPVEYFDLGFRNPQPELEWEKVVGTFPHEAVAQMTGTQYMEKRNELLSMYDELFDKMARGENPAAEWNEHFGQILQTLIEPPLEPYYRALGPNFFGRFLGETSGAS